MTEELNKLLLAPTATIQEALGLLNTTKRQILFTVDETKRVTGCLTDGDIRRALLRGETLGSSVEKAARKTFCWAKKGTPARELLVLMRKAGVRQVPVLDDHGHLLQVRMLDEFVEGALTVNCPAVIMAGGKGARLRPYTETIPKPLLKVGDRTLIERLLMDLNAKGVREFYITVNYLADQIMEHLGSGDRYGSHINYVRESKPLGTAGSLSLLKGKLESDFLVINGDVLSTIDLELLSEFHQQHKAIATVCSKVFTVTLPYGMVKLQGSDITAIEEKPDLTYTVNSGIYFFSPRVLDWVEPDQPLDMPELLSKLIHSGQSVKCFQSSEPWLDVGSHSDFEKAQRHLEYLVK